MKPAAIGFAAAAATLVILALMGTAARRSRLEFRPARIIKVPAGATIRIESAGGGGTGCITVKGQKGVNGGGDDGDATICGRGIAVGGAGGHGAGQ